MDSNTLHLKQVISLVISKFYYPFSYPNMNYTTPILTVFAQLMSMLSPESILIISDNKTPDYWINL